MEEIKQVYMSDSIKHFHKGFRSHWGLSDYEHKNEPALFVGMYSNVDLKAVENHKGKKLVMFSGADRNNSHLVNCEILADEFQSKHIKTKMPIRIVNMSYRSFDKFKPEPLGEKIYCYQSANTQGNKQKYRYDLLQKVINRYGDRVLIGYHPHTDEEMIDIYKECAIGLQFNAWAGFTSTKEMAHMGRISVSNRPFPFVQNFIEKNLIKVIDNALDLSLDPKEVARQSREFLNVGKDWLRW